MSARSEEIKKARQELLEGVIKKHADPETADKLLKHIGAMQSLTANEAINLRLQIEMFEK